MNIEQPFKILKMDKNLGNIVVSRRAILADSRSEERDQMLAQIKEGMTLTGVVKNITDYGAFIDLGSVDGLLHVTDISWSRINHPSEILSFGQEVQVVVIKYNEETKRISLGMKQLDANPWQNIENEFPIGKKISGKITNITDYGAFVELKEGVEGLVHSSEIVWGKTNVNPKKILQIGQEINFVILDVDIAKHRISLSIKRCVENPLIKCAEQNPVGTVIKAPVRNVTDFGIFVALDENTDGMIHESDLAWEGSTSQLLANYKKGDEIECKVLSIDIEKDRVALGVKQLHENSNSKASDEFKKNTIVTCTVTEINDDSLTVKISDTETEGLIKKLELSSEKGDQRTDRFVVGDRLDAKVISVEKGTNKVLLSIKSLELDERKKAIKEYGSADSGASLGDILGTAFNDKMNGKGTKE
jgi:small subunit ribosomal protein S1